MRAKGAQKLGFNEKIGVICVSKDKFLGVFFRKNGVNIFWPIQDSHLWTLKDQHWESNETIQVEYVRWEMTAMEHSVSWKVLEKNPLLPEGLKMIWIAERWLLPEGYHRVESGPAALQPPVGKQAWGAAVDLWTINIYWVSVME